MYLFSDGELVGAQWLSDNEDTRPNMPVDFLEHARQYLSREETAESLGRFVSSVILRIESDHSARARNLIEHWNAIRNGDKDQVNFCVLAGRMGLDPYDPEETTDEVAEAICSLEEDACTPVIRDLTEVTSPDFVFLQWKWVQETSAQYDLGRIPEAVQQGASVPTLDRNEMPHWLGYELASFVRGKAALPNSGPVSDIESLAIRISGKPLRMEERNHMPDHEVRAIVGWTDTDGAIVACPDYGTENSRFLLARGLFHALCSCDVSQRLITRAFTWDQKAGRSFAAELLAPRQALASRTGDRADGDAIEQLAREYQVSTIVVENQLENAGVEIMRE
jgi:hypothetical protein